MDTHVAPADLVFLHLSDIHFRGGRVGDAHDENRRLRRELEVDLRRLRSHLPRLDGVIISGDIAFGGKLEEYDYASAWIESICESVGCRTTDVMVIPGNHDVDRSSIPLDGDIDKLQLGIRKAASLEEYDERLAAILRDKGNGAILVAPLSAYNSFAKKYRCEMSCDRPYWERDFTLSDGTTLRFKGIVTTFLSSERDDVQNHKMFYGRAQRELLREPNVRNALIGHHPPSWTIEGDAADQEFSVLTFLQLFGHKHEQWATRIGDSVRFIAGAVHPPRNESNWLPRYAAIAISVVDARNLALRIYPRRWSSEEFKFMGDYNSEGHDFRDYSVPVEPRQN